MIRRALLVVVASIAALAACEGYRFRGVVGQTTTVENQAGTIGVTKTPPNIMIVQDLSGSMCEPIQQAAPNGTNCLATAGGVGVVGYCSVCSPGGGTCTDPSDCGSKMQLVSSTMTKIWTGLEKETFNLGLTAFGGPAEGAGCVPGTIQVAGGPAGTTIPEILSFYGAATPLGGTPTAATLAVAATDPMMTAAAPKYIILVTDGLPNCGTNPVTNACTTTPWTNAGGQSFGCASPADVAATNPSLTNAQSPAGCACSFGTCQNAGDPGCCPVSSGAQEAWYCLDDATTDAEISALYQKGITTFVVGLGYDYASNPGVVNEMAQCGQGKCGNASITAFQANNEAQLSKDLNGLIQPLLNTCTYTLTVPPAAPGLITVTLKGAPLVQGDPNGYTFTPPETITINGTACSATGGTANDLLITAIGTGN